MERTHEASLLAVESLVVVAADRERASFPKAVL